MEYFDVLNADGEAAGFSKARTEVHRDGDWHRTVHAWIINPRRELLIQKRSLEKDSNPGLWDVSAAGHLSAGETSIQAVVKEANEELGLSLGAEAFQYLFTVAQQAVSRDGSFIDNEFQDVYLMTADIPLTGFTVQQEEVSELRYIPVPELAELVLGASPEFVTHDEEYQKLFEVLSTLS